MCCTLHVYISVHIHVYSVFSTSLHLLGNSRSWTHWEMNDVCNLQLKSVQACALWVAVATCIECIIYKKAVGRGVQVGCSSIAGWPAPPKMLYLPPYTTTITLA